MASAKAPRQPQAEAPGSQATSIAFVGPDLSLVVPAEVLTRQGEMILDIPKNPDFGGPYLVRGELIDHFWAGKDELKDQPPVNVVARWSKLGDIFVGIWIENGVETLFSFRLPKPGRT
jgi:hypothetical protein